MTATLPRRPIVSPLTNSALGSWNAKTRRGVGNHLEPGVVAYDNEDGTRTTYLLPLAAIERMRPTAAGKPIIGKSGGFDHLKVEQGKKYDGHAVDSFWDGSLAWERINFVVDEPKTAEACEDGYQFSCAYIPTEIDETPGVWHNVPYDAVILNGEYTHFAVVPNPRYEGATIELLNSKEPSIMNKMLKAALSLFPVKDVREVLNSMEEEEKKKAADEKAAKENAVAEKRAAAQNAYDAAMKNAASDEDRAKAKAAFEKANAEIDAPAAAPDAAAPAKPLGGGDVPPEPGVPQPPVEAASASSAPSPADAQAEEKKKLEAQNAADEKAKKEAEDKAAAEKKNAEDAEKAKAEKEKKDAEEKQNALKIKTEAEKAAKAEALRQERFNSLREAALTRGGESGGGPSVTVVTLKDKEDLGRARYGSRE